MGFWGLFFGSVAMLLMAPVWASAGDSAEQKSDRVTRLFNIQLLEGGEACQGELWFRDGVIISPQEHADVEHDGGGLLAVPGFIDVQITGSYGKDFTNDPEGVEEVARKLVRHGVTSFLPTVISGSGEQYRKATALLHPRQVPGGAEILGIHLEGPALNHEYRGAHPSQHLITDGDLWKKLLSRCHTLDGVKMMTLAPEIPGALEAIEELTRRGVVTSVGHSVATTGQMLSAKGAGCRMVTHLGNRTTPYHQRDPAIMGCTLSDPEMRYSIINDGIHLHPIAVSVMWRAHSKGMILITDAMAAAGLEPGRYQLGDGDVIVDGYRATLADSPETLAGSTLTLDRALRNLVAFVGCSAAEAVDTVTKNPAELLGISATKGSLAVGTDADIVLLSDALEVQATFVRGERVYTTRGHIL